MTTRAAGSAGVKQNVQSFLRTLAAAAGEPTGAIESDGAAERVAARRPRPTAEMDHSAIFQTSEKPTKRLQSGDKP
jgi:hypothetical protein